MTERPNLYLTSKLLYLCKLSMKKLAILTLLSIFIFNTVGYYIVFKISQSEAKSEIKSKITQNLSTQELTAITLTKTEIATVVWLEKNKEFYFKNKLYDVVKTTENNPNSTTFYCLSDEKEEALFANLDEHILRQLNKNDNNKNSTSKKLSNHVVKIYFLQSQDIHFHKMDIQNNFSFLKLNYCSEFPETSSPPPEFI